MNPLRPLRWWRLQRDVVADRLGGVVAWCIIAAAIVAITVALFAAGARPAGAPGAPWVCHSGGVTVTVPGPLVPGR